MDQLELDALFIANAKTEMKLMGELELMGNFKLKEN
jgi:hypothetical protein